MNQPNLFALVRKNDLLRVRAALDAGADISVVDDFGVTLLHEAISSRNTAIAGALILRGIDLNRQDPDGLTPLHYAMEYKEEASARSILEAGGSTSIADKHGNEPLWTAVFNARGDYRLVKLLLEHGADPTHKNIHGKTPADIARQIGDATLFELLTGRSA